VEIRGAERVDMLVAVEKANERHGYELRWSQTSDGGKRVPWVRGRVLPVTSRSEGARRSWTGRRVPAVCWHAYRDVLAALFEQRPEATVRTALAVYRGREGFEACYPETAYRNVGSQMQPAYMPELCDC
jgi:hypothetical protein